MIWIQNGDVFTQSNSTVETKKELLPGNYLVKFNRQTDSYYLEKTKPFSIPEKIYGKLDTKFFVDRHISLEEKMGILFSGKKGNGKTMLCKKIAFERNVPVIVLTEGEAGKDFISFITSFNQPICVFIDEFDKLYNENTNELLAVLDGVTSGSNILWLLTSNSDATYYMKNRPGRVRYHIKYESLSIEDVEEIIDDKLTDKTHKDFLLKCHKFYQFNTDSLTQLIKDLNETDKTPRELLDIFNLETEEESTWSCKIYYNDVLIGDKPLLRNHPLSGELGFSYYIDEKTENLPEKFLKGHIYVEFSSVDLDSYEVSSDKDGEEIILTSTKGYKYIFREKICKKYSMVF